MDSLKSEIVTYCIKNSKKRESEGNKNFLRGLFDICNKALRESDHRNLAFPSLVKVLDGIFSQYDDAMSQLEQNDDQKIKDLVVILKEFSFKNYIFDKNPNFKNKFDKFKENDTK